MSLYDTNLIGFLVGLVVGLITGCFLGYKIARHKFGKEEEVLLHNLFGGGMALLWAGTHVYAIIVGSIQVPFIFDVIGGLAMGQTLGIDLASQIAKFRK